MGILALTVGLVRSESATDLNVLTAIGATSNTRRGIVSATAAGLGLLGALIGTATAYLTALAYFRSQLRNARNLWMIVGRRTLPTSPIPGIE